MIHRELKRTRRMNCEPLRCLLSFILAAALVNPGFAQTPSLPQLGTDRQQVLEKVGEQEVGTVPVANPIAAEVGSPPAEYHVNQFAASMQTGSPSVMRITSPRISLGTLAFDASRPLSLFPKQITPPQSTSSSKGRSKGQGAAMLIIGLAAAGGGGYLLSKGLKGQEEPFQRTCFCIPCSYGPDYYTCEILYRQCMDECHSAGSTITKYDAGQTYGGTALLCGGVLLVIGGIMRMR
jgi:hypothetical protein